MKVTAIVCEYNPLTNGHVKHLQVAREETGADTIFCVMSGSFTQRGEPAITDKYLRAEQAVLHGADIVVELPTIYAISPADNFAFGAIKTISTFPNVQYISFGSECGDIEKLIKVANFLYKEPDNYKTELQKLLKLGNSFPKARALALKSLAKNNEDLKGLEEILEHPNNTLGIAYIIAAKTLNYKIKFHTVKRLGADFNNDELHEDYSSSSAVRQALKEGRSKDLINKIPKSTLDMLNCYKPQDDGLGSMVLFTLKNINGSDFEKIYDVTGGIHNRILISAAQSATYEELLKNAKTKNITMARLKRIGLYALFNITKEDYINATQSPAFAQILAISCSRKEELLPAYYNNCKNVLTRYSDVSKVDKSLRRLIKLDFAAQGTLSIINRVNYLNKKMLIVDFTRE